MLPKLQIIQCTFDQHSMWTAILSCDLLIICLWNIILYSAWLWGLTAYSLLKGVCWYLIANRCALPHSCWKCVRMFLTRSHMLCWRCGELHSPFLISLSYQRARPTWVSTLSPTSMISMISINSVIPFHHWCYEYKIRSLSNVQSIWLCLFAHYFMIVVW